MMMGFGLLGVVFMLLFWGSLIALAVWAAGALFSGSRREPGAPGPQNLNARQIVEIRYAHGDLTRDQYELMKHDLG